MSWRSSWSLRSEVQNASTASAGTWVGFIDFLRPLLDDHRHHPVYVSVKCPFWRRGDMRANKLLPVQRIEGSQGTWEVCVFAGGLMRENPVPQAGLTLEDFLGELDALSESAAHCRLVISDERATSKEGLVKLARRRGAEWTGIPLEEIPVDEDYVVRFDLPVRELSVLVRYTPPGILLQVPG